MVGCGLQEETLWFLGGDEQLCFLFFLRRFDGFKTPVEEKVVDDLEATGNDEGEC
jgi:hypothetical protein